MPRTTEQWTVIIEREGDWDKLAHFVLLTLTSSAKHNEASLTNLFRAIQQLCNQPTGGADRRSPE